MNTTGRSEELRRVLRPLKGRQRELMRTILRNVETHRLQEMFDFFEDTVKGAR